MKRPQILVTNDDGWDAPGLAALRALAIPLGDVYVLAPLEGHSDMGHRVTTKAPMQLTQTGPREYHLGGTPADCVRVALTALLPQIDVVLAGINQGGNLGVDIYSSGTVAAAREAAFLGRRSIAVSQFVRSGVPLDWDRTAALAAPVVESLLRAEWSPKHYWNVNLPHLPGGHHVPVVHCTPDDQPMDIRFERDGDVFHYKGTYATRPQTRGRDVEQCFEGIITVSCLRA